MLKDANLQFSKTDYWRQRRFLVRAQQRNLHKEWKTHGILNVYRNHEISDSTPTNVCDVFVSPMIYSRRDYKNNNKHFFLLFVESNDRFR